MHYIMKAAIIYQLHNWDLMTRLLVSFIYF